MDPYVCLECGFKASSPFARCPHCHGWNTVADEQRHVQFKCDASLPKEVFEPVLKAIAEGGGIIEAVGDKDE